MKSSQIPINVLLNPILYSKQNTYLSESSSAQNFDNFKVV